VRIPLPLHSERDMGKVLTPSLIVTNLLLELWNNKSISDIPDEEFLELIHKLRSIRQMQVKRTRVPSHLDLLLDGLDYEKSRIIHESFKEVKARREKKEKD